MVNNIIIMAGGAGKRLWPASLGANPKQFMRIGADASLFSGALDRSFQLGITGAVYVVTHEDHVPAALAECRRVEEKYRKRIIIMSEPIAKNTAPALALAGAGMIMAGKISETSLVMAADHIISPIETFVSSVEAASLEAQKGYIVPYGIVPSHPATGYGYIETGKVASKGYEVLSFREKPDEQTAYKYVESGRYYWNAGLFTYRNDVFMEELRVCSPEVAQAFSNPSEDWFKKRTDQGITVLTPTQLVIQRYHNCPSISVDYAVMEKTSRIRMVKADFQWNDVGSWDAVAGIDTKLESPVYSHQSRDNFVYADCPVALCGVEGLIVVVANNRVMVCKKGASQLVKLAAEDDLSEEKNKIFSKN